MAYLHYFTDMHCGTCGSIVNFDLVYSSPRRVSVDDLSSSVRWEDSREEFSGLFICSRCKNPHFVDFRVNTSLNRNPAYADFFAKPYRLLNRLEYVNITNPVTSGARRGYEVKNEQLGQNLRPCFLVGSVYTQNSATIPQNLPSNIHDMYVNDLLQVTGSNRHVIISCRAILEAACKHKLSSDNGKLVEMIDALVQAGFIPRVISEWAHTIRLLGNEAVHKEQSPPREVAMEVMSFTTTILELLYTYPARISALRDNGNNIG